MVQKVTSESEYEISIDPRIILSPNSSKQYLSNTHNDSVLFEGDQNQLLPDRFISCLNELEKNGSLVAWKVSGKGRNLSVNVKWSNSDEHGGSNNSQHNNRGKKLKCGPAKRKVKGGGKRKVTEVVRRRANGKQSAIKLGTFIEELYIVVLVLFFKPIEFL